MRRAAKIKLKAQKKKKILGIKRSKPQKFDWQWPVNKSKQLSSDLIPDWCPEVCDIAFLSQLSPGQFKPARRAKNETAKARNLSCEINKTLAENGKSRVRVGPGEKRGVKIGFNTKTAWKMKLIFRNLFRQIDFWCKKITMLVDFKTSRPQRKHVLVYSPYFVVWVTQKLGLNWPLSCLWQT